MLFNKHKKTLTFLVFASLFLLVVQHKSLAQTGSISPTSSAKKITPTDAKPTVIIDKEIKILKDKIATKVSQLRELDKKIISGKLSKKSNDSFEVEQEDKKIYSVDFDQNLIKIISLDSLDKETVDYANLKKGDYLIIEGNLIDNSIVPIVIYKSSLYVVDSGKITDINQDDFNLDIFSGKKDSITLDIETTTKQLGIDLKTLKIAKYGFSKIKTGDIIHFAAIQNKKGRYSAIRTLVIPQEIFSK